MLTFSSEPFSLSGRLAAISNLLNISYFILFLRGTTNCVSICPVCRVAFTVPPTVEWRDLCWWPSPAGKNPTPKGDLLCIFFEFLFILAAFTHKHTFFWLILFCAAQTGAPETTVNYTNVTSGVRVRATSGSTCGDTTGKVCCFSNDLNINSFLSFFIRKQQGNRKYLNV